jgi:hypothetical protein
LKPERWGSPLAQEEKYQGQNICDKRTITMIIIIIIILTTTVTLILFIYIVS